MDYPKNGIPVELTRDTLPKTLIRCKPDWHAAEVVSPRETDYYTSTRALGELYRNITLTDPEPITETWGDREPLRDPISQVLRGRVEDHIGDDASPSQELSPALEFIYKGYQEELSYIRSTHTLSNTPGAKLLEAEIVVGTILAKCSQKRYRSDRIYRMRLHTTTLVKEVKNALLPLKKVYESGELVEGLKQAWKAWEFSQTRPFKEDGASSFGLIALDIIFDTLERLKSGTLNQEEQAIPGSPDLSDLDSEATLT